MFNSISLFYGINSYHFYLSQAIPLLLITQLPFFLHGLLLSTGTGGKEETALKLVMGGTVGIYSLLAHKEFRFLHPLLPLFHVFVTKSLVNLYYPRPTTSTTFSKISNKLLIRPRHFFLLLFSLVPAVYLISFHSLAQVSILTTLRSLPELKSVGFLMPCHSTPWQSHLHLKRLEVEEFGSGEGGRAWFITCEPPIL